MLIPSLKDSVFPVSYKGYNVFFFEAKRMYVNLKIRFGIWFNEEKIQNSSKKNKIYLGIVLL